MANYDRN